MKLQHYAAYLEHKVGIQFKHHINYYLDGITSNNIHVNHEDYLGFKISISDERIKLILRPLSDLTKEIEVNGELFVPIVELLKIVESKWYNENLNTRYSKIEVEQSGKYIKAWFSFMAMKTLAIDIWNILDLPYWIVEKLLSWHFDIFNLIPAGKAVDINTIKI